MNALPRPAVASPCIDVCRMDAAKAWCEGCLRSIEEIAAWSGLSDDGKREVWRLIDARRAARGDTAPTSPKPSGGPLFSHDGSASKG